MLIKSLLVTLVACEQFTVSPARIITTLPFLSLFFKFFRLSCVLDEYDFNWRSIILNESITNGLTSL